jgi:hypothetical protein
MSWKHVALALSLFVTTTASSAPPHIGDMLASSAGELAFTTIEVPGATFTQAMGIGPGGDVVGAYVSGGVVRGFLLSRGAFTTIEFPGASSTVARGIGPSGEIVGTFRFPTDVSPVAERGFLRSRSGAYQEIAIAGYKNIMPQRILGDGTIVGCVHDDDTTASMKGFMMSRRGIQVDDIYASMHNGVTPDRRRIIGLWTNSGVGEAYIIDDGTFTSFLVPGSVLTQAWDVNAAGEVVGIHVLPGPLVRGFLLSRTGFTTLHFPGATHTRAFGVNSSGDIVGNYVMGGVTRGFVVSRTGRAGH